MWLHCSEMGTVDLNDLSVFVTVVETASFSHAASRLGLPKSSVSRAIVRLEAATKARVLHRTTRKVALSTAGRALYEKVRAQVVSLRQATDDLPEMSEEPSGRLRVTAVFDSSEFFADVVARFLDRHPSVQVELYLTNQYLDLVAEGIDLALRFSTRGLKDSTLNARKLSPSTLQIYASPSYVARQGMPRTPRDLERHDWVVHRSAVTVRLEGGGPPTTITTRGRIECNGFAFLRAALVNGCGLGLLEPSEAEATVAAGKLVRVLPRWSCPVSNLWAVWPGARQPPRKVSAFLDVVVEALGTHPFSPVRRRVE
jgi:DNA-binding transcriptional LysR family regulator